MNEARFPYDYIPDSAKGRPLFNASLYYGIPDLDPEIVANQISISLRQEDGSIVSVSQPVNTGAGGVPMYNGSPVTVLIDEDIFSFKALDKNGSQIYYEARAESALGSGATVGNKDTYADVRAITDTGFDYLIVGGANTLGDGGGGVFVKLSSGSDDDGITLEASGGAVFGRVYSGEINVVWFGADPTGASDDTAAFIAACNSPSVLPTDGKGRAVYVPAGEYNITTVPIGRFGATFILDPLAFINITGGGFERNITQVTRETYVTANAPIYGDVYILPLIIKGGNLVVENNATAASNRVPFLVFTGVGTAPSSPGIGLTKSFEIESNIHLLGANSIGVGVHGGWGTEIKGTIVGDDVGYAIDMAPDGTYSASSHAQEINVAATIYSCNPVRSEKGTCTNSCERLNFLPGCNMQFVQKASLKAMNLVNIDSILFVSITDSMDIIDCGRVSIAGSYFQATGEPSNTLLRGIVNTQNCANFVWAEDNKIIINSNVTGRRGIIFKTNSSNDTVSTKVKGGEFLCGGSPYAIEFSDQGAQKFNYVEIEGVYAGGVGLSAPVNFFPLLNPATNVTIGNIDADGAATKFIEGFSPAKLDIASLTAPLYRVDAPVRLRSMANSSGIVSACLSIPSVHKFRSLAAPSGAISGFSSVSNANNITVTSLGRESVILNLLQNSGLSVGANVEATATLSITSVNV